MQPNELLSPATPLFTLTVQSLEPIFKSWIKEVLTSSEPVNDSEPEFFTRQDVCRILHLSLPTVDRYTRIGILEGKKVGNRILYSKESLEKALNIISESKAKK